MTKDKETPRSVPLGIPAALWLVLLAAVPAQQRAGIVVPEKAQGYRGIWYANQPSDDEFKYKYSGGLGTYCAKHIPMAVYAKAVDRTFFVYGGTFDKDMLNLLEMVSYYDHKTGSVPRPRILHDKNTDDAHDNPVLSIDEEGHLWVFCSSHGTSRPSYIYRSVKPYDIDSFELVRETNFSYPQPWWITGRGFLFLHTLYQGGRFLHWATSPDGCSWPPPQLLGGIQEGHYQISWRRGEKVGTAFNYHPAGLGLNNRTNLYYLESADFGGTWTNVLEQPVPLPLESVDNSALVHNYAAEKLLVYLKDLNFDGRGNPVLLYVTSRGYAAGPKNNPRTWTTAWWNGRGWEIRSAMTSDNNYDTGCLHVEEGDLWRLIGPTETGPQPFNPGGEVAMWTSADQGKSWQKTAQLTDGSPYNHTYCRRPVDAHPGFYAFWADGNPRAPSESRLYFCSREGKVWRLPETMEKETAQPEELPQPAFR